MCGVVVNSKTEQTESIIKHKAVKRLLELKQKMLSKIICESQRKTEYPKSESETREWVGAIANPAKWDYFGLLSKEEVRELELLEYLLNDDRNEIVRYAEWKPQKQN